MRLSTRGRYGTRALLDLALHPDKQPVLLKDIARRQEISLTYLEHLVTPLVSAGILRSTRGPRGGVSLARPPEEVRLSEVIRLLEGSTSPAECIDEPKSCERADSCAVRGVWNDVAAAINGVLQATTLKDLAERQKALSAKAEKMYYI